MAAPQAAAVPPWPFPVGVFDEEIQNSYDRTITVGAATVQFPDVEIEPDGWARGWSPRSPRAGSITAGTSGSVPGVRASHPAHHERAPLRQQE